MSKHKAMGLISTHDLVLGDIATDNELIENCHFKEFYQDSKLKFDYKLRSGISSTTNAVYLMEMVGISMEEQEENKRD